MSHTYLAPQPHSRHEVVLVRFLFALLVWDLIPWSAEIPYTGQPNPVGLAGLGIDLTWITRGGTLFWYNLLLGGLLIPYILGRALPFVTPVITLLAILPGTLENSQGYINHDTQLIPLILVAQSVWFIWRAIRHGLGEKGLVSPERDRGAIYAAQQAIAAVYVVSGLTKVKESGFFGWIQKAVNYPIQLRKTNLSSYYSTLQDPGNGGSSLSGWASGAEAFFANHTALGQLLLSGGLILEVFAFVLLIGRRSALAVGCLIIFFHTTVSLFMKLNFRVNMEAAFIFLILPSLVAWLEAWSERRTRLARTRA